MKVLTLLLALACTACGGHSPSAPTDTPTLPPLPPVSLNITVTGHLTATNGGQALPDVQAALGAATATTDGSGSFSASMMPTGSVPLTLTGAGIVPRSLRVAATGNRDMSVDAIALSGGFDLNFYKQFVRNSSDPTGALQPLRRWTQNPSLYLQTNGLANARTLDMIEAVARAAVPQWTNGQFNVVTVERGSESRAGQAGWLTVLFSPETAHCGLADVGKSGGLVTFYPNIPACGCAGYQMAPTAVRHEFGHAMGYYHTDSRADVMNSVANQCDTPISARERYHAAVVYSRPVGNVDPDTDPTSAINLAPMRVVQ